MAIAGVLLPRRARALQDVTLRNGGEMVALLVADDVDLFVTSREALVARKAA
ncbi:MAG TPA: hypothetical protein VIF62_06460 [Labilithrix sp.]|jgi:hypothetical protein